jgi:hypothetical protein
LLIDGLSYNVPISEPKDANADGAFNISDCNFLELTTADVPAMAIAPAPTAEAAVFIEVIGLVKNCVTALLTIGVAAETAREGKIEAAIIGAETARAASGIADSNSETISLLFIGDAETLVVALFPVIIPLHKLVAALEIEPITSENMLINYPIGKPIFKFCVVSGSTSSFLN